MYQIELYRPRESFMNFTMRCPAHDVEISYRPGFQYGLGMLCRELVAKGLPDGAVQVIEIGVRPEVRLEQNLASMHHIATLPVEHGSLPKATEEESTESDEPDMPSSTISPAVKTALAALIASPDAWATMGGRMKGMLSARDFVVVESKQWATVTEAGRVAHDTFEVVAPISFVTSVKAKDGVFKAPTEADLTTTKVPLVTVKQREAFEIVLRNSGNWDDLHGKTKNFMINAGWVKMVGDKPTITDEGRKIVEALGL